MLVHGVPRLITHNVGDFAGFTEIEVIVVQDISPVSTEPSEEP